MWWVPQPPQLFGSRPPMMLTSQPSFGSPLQSAQLGSLHETEHAPPVHVGVSLLVEQAAPQPPQFATSLDTSLHARRSSRG